MLITIEHKERFAKMTFATVYHRFVKKVEKKGRTKEELNLQSHIAKTDVF